MLHVKVGVADTGRFDLHVDFVGPQIGQLDGLQRALASNFIDDGCSGCLTHLDLLYRYLGGSYVTFCSILLRNSPAGHRREHDDLFTIRQRGVRPPAAKHRAA
jgi:hypothetical protein